MSEQGEEPPWAGDFRRLNQAIHNYALHVGDQQPAVAVGLQSVAGEIHFGLAGGAALRDEVQDGYLVKTSMGRKTFRKLGNYVREYLPKGQRNDFTAPDRSPRKTVIWIENYRERFIDAYLIQLLKEHGLTVVKEGQLTGNPQAVHQIVRHLVKESPSLSETIRDHIFRLRDEVCPDLTIPASVGIHIEAGGFRYKVLNQTLQHLLILRKASDFHKGEEKFLVYRNGGRPFGLLARTGWGGNLKTIHIPHGFKSGSIFDGDSGFHADISLVRSEEQVADCAAATGQTGAPTRVVGFAGDLLDFSRKRVSYLPNSRKPLGVIALTERRLADHSPQTLVDLATLVEQLTEKFEVLIKLKYPPRVGRSPVRARKKSDRKENLDDLITESQLDSLIPAAAVAVVISSESNYISNVLIEFARNGVPCVAIANPKTPIINLSPLISYCRSDFDSGADEVLRAVNDPLRADKQIERGGLSLASNSWDEAAFLDAFNG